MTEGIPTHEPELPRSPEMELIDKVHRQLEVVLRVDQDNLNSLTEIGEEASSIEGRPYHLVCGPDDIIPVVYNRLIWKPREDLSFHVGRIITGSPITDDSEYFEQPNDVFVTVYFQDGHKEHCLLNAAGFYTYVTAEQITPYNLNAQYVDRFDRHDVYQVKDGGQPRLSVKEIKTILDMASIMAQNPARPDSQL